MNYKNVELAGQVLDELTSAPIQGAKVDVSFWVYDTSPEVWESIRIDRSLLTDINGKFSCKINRAEAFDLSIEKSGYKSYNHSETLNKSSVKISVSLAKE